MSCGLRTIDLTIDSLILKTPLQWQFTPKQVHRYGLGRHHVQPIWGSQPLL